MKRPAALAGTDRSNPKYGLPQPNSDGFLELDYAPFDVTHSAYVSYFTKTNRLHIQQCLIKFKYPANKFIKVNYLGERRITKFNPNRMSAPTPQRPARSGARRPASEPALTSGDSASTIRCASIRSTNARILRSPAATSASTCAASAVRYTAAK